ncbi:PREDICTED: uncharacterized protein LOC109238880 [Nicotiana attenuata]|uniref:uncharacterized protein LOC109238880 n=1 Tax=Nicotiana attenuata TaxID=49451 RepID=UPI000904A307|nr:PREDICTED: uncharacterized protein LOC109238880 [Nicotiana attenuata]
MNIPVGFARQGETHKKVCKLHKSLYGLKQAPRPWNMKLTEALLHMGFQQSHYDYSLFTKKARSDIVIILVYVDDLLISGNNQQLLCDTRTDLKKRFKMKDLGELKFFPCIEFARSKQGILMCQMKYALELISESGLSGAKPAESSSKLTAYCDSDWRACIQTRRSVTGYLVKIGSALISWKSKKQSTVSKNFNRSRI